MKQKPQIRNPVFVDRVRRDFSWTFLVSGSSRGGDLGGLVRWENVMWSKPFAAMQSKHRLEKDFDDVLLQHLVCMDD